MDAMVFVGFLLAGLFGVAFLALVLKYLDVEEQRAAGADQARDGTRAPALVADVPAFFGRPLATEGFSDRLPALRELDRRHIAWALGQAGGNCAQAAELLGTSEGTLALLIQHCALPADGGAHAHRHAAEAAVVARDAFDDRLFAFLQNHIRAEQDVVAEFVHLPSIESLYRPTRPTASMH